MNISLAAAKKERPSTDGGFSNDNNWLAMLPVGTTFYCVYADHKSYVAHERIKTWEQGRVVRLGDEHYVESSMFSKTYELIHSLKEEDSG